MILRLFYAEVSGKDLSEIIREDVIKFLDKRKKSTEPDPDKKWIQQYQEFKNKIVEVDKKLDEEFEKE